MKLRLVPILALFSLFAIVLVFLVPVFEVPDEPEHLGYVDFVATHRQLPDQYIPEQTSAGEGHQAPLYYVAAAAVVTLFQKDHSIDITPIPNKEYVGNGGTVAAAPLFKHLSSSIFASSSDEVAFYLLRLLSVVCGVCSLLVAYLITGYFFKEEKWRLAAVFFMATLPQFIFNSIGVSNDSLTTLLASLVILYSLKILSGELAARRHIVLGLLLGLAILTKKTALFLAAVVVLEYLYLLWKAQSGRRWLVARNALLCGSLALLVASPFFIHNYLSYNELLGSHMELVTVSSTISRSIFSSYFISPFLPGVLVSFIGAFGWVTFRLPTVLIAVYALLILLAVAGLIAARRRSLGERNKLVLAGLYVAGAFASLVVINLHLDQSQGRTVFPALSLIAVLLTLGLRQVVERYCAPRWQRLLPVIIGGFFMLCDLVMVVQVHQFYSTLSHYL